MIEMNPIERFHLKEDVCLVYELANDFDQDIPLSFLRLAERMKNDGKKRDCYGVVLKDNGVMQYRAAFTEAEMEEGKSLGVPTMIIPKGNYESIRMEDWNQKIMQIGPTFDQILKSGKVNIESPCIEFYKSEKELVCMVISKDSGF